MRVLSLPFQGRSLGCSLASLRSLALTTAGVGAMLIGLSMMPALAQQAGTSPENTAAVRFIDAIENAAVPEQSEISNALVALVPENPKTIWDASGTSPRVRMVTWMSESSFQRFWAEPATLPTDKTAPPSWGVIWVTPAPQVQEFCKALPGDAEAVHTRLKEYLGLAPDRSYARFVEILIAPENLRRPCPDPEVTDTTCGLTLANDLESDYRAWFLGNYANAYGVTGAPWTRLGYTYDWVAADGSASGNRPVGASEYILTGNAPYSIVGRYTTAEYCGR